MLTSSQTETDSAASIFKPTLVLMCGRMLSFAATFFIPVVLVRVFSQHDFGTYKQVFLVYMTVFGIAQFGMSESLYYFVPRAPEKSGRYIVNSFLMLLLGTGVFSFFIILKRAGIAAALSNPDLAQYMPLLALYLLLMNVSAPLEVVMVSQKQYFRAALTYSLSDLTRALVFIAPVLLVRELKWLLIASCGFALLRVGFAFFYAWRQFRGDLRPDGTLLRQQLAYALPFEMAVVIEALQANYHQYAVSHYFDAATFAIYSVGCLQIPLVDFVAAPAGNVMMVRMAEEIRDNRPRVVLALWHETTRKLALVFVPLFALLAAAGHDVIELLFTNKYAASIPIFIVWSAGVTLAALQTDAGLRVYAQTRFLLGMNLVRLAVIGSLIYFSLREFGLLGAVLITLFASLVAKMMSLARLKRLMHVSVGELLPWGALATIVAASAASCALALGLKLLAVPILVRLLVIGTVFVVCYCTLIWRSRVLTGAEKVALVRWVRRKVLRDGSTAMTSAVEDKDKCAALSGS